MQLKSFFFGAFGLLALASCSNDELTSVNRDGDEIAFSVVTNPATRAADVYCNQNKPTSFKVWATYNNATYINGDQITYENNKWVNKSGTRYWPDGGEVTFYAQVNADDEFKWNDGSNVQIENFTVAANVTEQKDLLYAVKKQSKGEENNTATLNFRHALSQIVFRAKNTNKNLYVEISGVSVCKVKNQGTFTYPTGSTDDKVGEHNGNGSIDYDTQNWGSWKLADNTSKYDVTFAPVKLNGSETATPVSLTSKNEAGKEFNNNNAMLLLPQTTTAWVVGENATTGNPENQEGTYFLVKCRIFNVANGTVDTENDVLLWGNEDGTGEDAAIPVKITWEQGKKYIYTFVFGDGNGGYNPDPEDPNKPDPVLVPITFDVTVDDFVPVENEDISMNEPGEEGQD